MISYDHSGDIVFGYLSSVSPAYFSYDWYLLPLGDKIGENSRGLIGLALD